MTCSVAEAAVLDFEPWDASAQARFSDGREIMDGNRQTLLFAIGICCRTKKQLMKFLRRAAGGGTGIIDPTAASADWNQSSAENNQRS